MASDDGPSVFGIVTAAHDRGPALVGAADTVILRLESFRIGARSARSH